jgi:hypothetical protein
LNVLKKIQELTKSEAFLLHYQKTFRRFEIEFYEKKLDSIFNLKFIFEHGTPTRILKKEYIQDLRNKK